MTPDYEKAAIKATETIITHRICTAPVDPMPILKSMPGTLMLSYADAAQSLGIDRHDLISLFGIGNQDAATFAREIRGRLCYFVIYNQRLPFYMLQRGLARELGHIVLGHDGSRPENVRMTEAICFAQHLLCPRPVIKAVEAAGIPLTVEVVGAITGCYERCLAGMRKTPGIRVPAELNRRIKEQFKEYISNFIDFQNYLKADDESMLANFGTFMDNYEE